MSRRREPPSRTDVLLFKQLANPDRVDIPENASSLLRDVGAEQPQGAFDRLTAKFVSSAKSRDRNNKKRKHDSSDDDSDDDSGSDSDESSGDDSGDESGSDSDDSGSDGEQDSGSDDDSIDENVFKKHKSGKPNRSAGGAGFQMPAFAGAGAGLGFQKASSSGSNNFGPPQMVHDEIADRTQRQFYMNELIAIQRQGYQLSIALDETTPTYVLKTEYDLVQENQAAVQGVENLRAGLRLGMSFLEMGNEKINSPVPLSGWTENTFETNPNVFDRSLRRIYNMYWRNSFSHPMMELGMALCFSGAGYMMRNTQSRASQTEFRQNAMPMGGTGAMPRMPQHQQGFQRPQQMPNPNQGQRNTTAFRTPPTPPVPDASGRRTLRPPFAGNPRGNNPSAPNMFGGTPGTAGPGQPVTNVPVT